MKAPFAPSDVVVCVDDRVCPILAALVDGWISRGRHYRVVDAIVWGGAVGVHVHGIRLDRLHWFRADRFRKIDDEVTEGFRETLRTLPVKQRERA